MRQTAILFTDVKYRGTEQWTNLPKFTPIDLLGEDLNAGHRLYALSTSQLATGWTMTRLLYCGKAAVFTAPAIPEKPTGDFSSDPNGILLEIKSQKYMMHSIAQET